MVERICAICGAVIQNVNPRATNQKYCGVKCLERSRRNCLREYRRDVKKIPLIERRNTENDLEQCVREARKLGISYGKYMVQRGNKCGTENH
jgi:hypothetical protein